MTLNPLSAGDENFLTVRVDSREISIEEFWEIQKHIAIVLEEVDKQVFKRTKRSVKWNVEETKKGSLMLILFGVPTSKNIEPRSVSNLIETVKTGIERISEIPERPDCFTDRALKSLGFLSKKRGTEKVRALQIGSESGVTDITTKIAPNVDELIGPRQQSYGSVEGMLEGLNIHEDPYFEIYSLLDDRAIKAYFDRKILDYAISLLGKRVYTYGFIRSRNDGTRISISVQEIEPFPEESELPTIEEMAGILGGEQ